MIGNAPNRDSRFEVSRAGPAFPSPCYEVESGTLRHTLFYKNVDFVGDRGFNWNVGSGVLASDRQAEGNWFDVAAPAIVAGGREDVVVVAETFVVLRPHESDILHANVGSASDLGKPTGDTIKAKALEGAAACSIRKPTEVKIANAVLGSYFRRLK